MNKGHVYFKKKNFSSGFFFFCGDAFCFLPGGELFFINCAFLFITLLPAPDCGEFWEGNPRTFLPCLVTAAFKFSSLTHPVLRLHPTVELSYQVLWHLVEDEAPPNGKDL